MVYLYTPWGQTEPRRLETAGDETIALRVRERVAVKDRLFRLAAADVGSWAAIWSPGAWRCGPSSSRCASAGKRARLHS